jgi:hypothetical protein
MGLMKECLIKAGFSVKKAEKFLKPELKVETKEDYSKCRHCESEKVEYDKVIGWGKKMGNVYHFNLICHNCGKTYHIPRIKENYERVKDTPWRKSKAVRQMEMTQKLTGKFYQSAPATPIHNKEIDQPI